MACRDPGIVTILITPQDADGLLDVLRWQENMAVINDFGDHVWLKQCLNTKGVRIGITDCCFVDDPCPQHMQGVE